MSDPSKADRELGRKNRQFAVPMSDEEYRAIKVAVASGDKTLGQFIREAALKEAASPETQLEVDSATRE